MFCVFFQLKTFRLSKRKRKEFELIPKKKSRVYPKVAVDWFTVRDFECFEARIPVVRFESRPLKVVKDFWWYRIIIAWDFRRRPVRIVDDFSRFVPFADSLRWLHLSEKWFSWLFRGGIGRLQEFIWIRG